MIPKLNFGFHYRGSYAVDCLYLLEDSYTNG